MPGRRNFNNEKPKDLKGTTKKLVKEYMMPYKFQLLFMTIFAIAGTIFNIVGPKILGNATTEIFNGITSKISGGSGINFEKIAHILISLLVLYVVRGIFSSFQGFLMTHVAQKISYKMRNDIAKKINKLPMKYFDKKTNGEILSIVTNDVDTLQQNMNQSIDLLITSVCTIIGIIVMMFSISVSMTLISLIIFPITVGFIAFIAKKSQKYFKQQQDYLGHVNGQVEEVYSGHNIVKAFNYEENAIDKFQDANKTLYDSSWKSQFLSGLMMPIMGFMSNISYVLISILGGYYCLQGKITVGNIQSFIQYSKQLNQPIQEIAQIVTSLQSMAAAAERVFEFLDEEEEPVINTNNKADDLKGNIKFDHVKFGYDENKIIIHDFNADVKEGQKIAIVGPTGAGKTTIVKLLMRFYDINSGKIIIDGHDINEYPKEETRKLFGMVLQDTWLFNGTIMENIKYGNEDKKDSDAIEAAKSAHVHHFIKTLPNGYDMVVNEDSTNISQGQKQLLTIARVILDNPKILILDEATSNIDTMTEVQIQKAMDNLMKGRTSFIIAHRLSTIKNADLILVMKHGDIVEQGTHESLLAKNGEYAKLYNSQFEDCQ